MTENLDVCGNKINDWLIPRTLRINDKAFEQSADVELVDFIFSKGAADKKYDTLCYAAPDKEIPQEVVELLAPSLTGFAPETVVHNPVTLCL